MEEINSEAEESRLNLLDLPDDVLLIILSNLNSNDLCSLGSTCSRLQRVTSDKSLWLDIDFKLKRSTPPFLFLFENLPLINKNTRTISLAGKKKPIRLPGSLRRQDCSSSSSSSSSSEDEDYVELNFDLGMDYGEKNQKVKKDEDLEKCPMDDFSRMLSKVQNNIDKKWFRLPLLSAVANRCPELNILRLQYMRLHYSTPPILPSWNSLTELSLRGSRLLTKVSGKYGPLYELSVKLPNLVCLDIGCCSWVESHCFMAISKFNYLRTLLLDGCYNLGNCVAYISLAACLGFPLIQELDLRDTQFGDSDLLSFKRNVTINKIILGRRQKGSNEELLSSRKPRNPTPTSSGASGNSKTEEGVAGQSNGCSQSRKRKYQNHKDIFGWKRARPMPDPEEALVIHVDLGLGIRVEHIHEAGNLDLPLSVHAGIGNSVTDVGISSLGIDGLPGLTDLVLAGSGSAITDRALVALQKRVGLCSLDVRKTNVTEAGVKSFLEKCPNVTVHSDFDSKILDIYPV